MHGAGTTLRVRSAVRNDSRRRSGWQSGELRGEPQRRAVRERPRALGAAGMRGAGRAPHPPDSIQMRGPLPPDRRAVGFTRPEKATGVTCGICNANKSPWELGQNKSAFIEWERFNGFETSARFVILFYFIFYLH